MNNVSIANNIHSSKNLLLAILSIIIIHRANLEVTMKAEELILSLVFITVSLTATSAVDSSKLNAWH